jgi:hypothetical protein
MPTAPGRRRRARPTGGSAAAGGRSTSCLAPRRGPPAPRAHRSSTSASTDTTTAVRPARAGSSVQALKVYEPPLSVVLSGQWAGTSWAVQCAERLAYRGSQISIGQGRRRRGGAEEIGARVQLGPHLSGDGSQPTPDPVAHHCAAGPTADGVGDPRRFGGVTSQPGYRDRASSHAPAAPAQGLEGGPVTDRPDQAVRLWRPLRRRDDRMARPALVDMRCRNPCFLARFLTFG